MKEIKVYSTGMNLENFGGAQKVMVEVHNGIKAHFNAKILGVCDYKNLNSNYNIQSSEYVKLRNPFRLKEAVILLHARKLTTYYAILNKLFFLNLKLIYISHNIYNEKRMLTFLPKDIVSISDKVTENLKRYFKVKDLRITKIHNGIPDQWEVNNRTKASAGFIKILYAARITDVKRQLQVVKNLKGKLPDRIRIYFAGTGPLLDELKNEIGDSHNFEALGFIKEMKSIIIDSHYMMLFSEKEGLPISLMEGAMFGKPLIINDVGGNMEIGIPGVNAFLAASWEDLEKVLLTIPSPESLDYERLSEQSRNVYENYFQYQTMIDKYKILINKVAYGK